MLGQTRDTKPTAPTSLIAPYDVVTVISQRSLNAHLARAYDVNPLLQAASLKRPVGKADNYSGFEISFDPPKVELQLATENKIVTLVLNIKSGNLKFFTISGMEIIKEDLPIPPITIALDVNLVSQTVPFASLPKDIQGTFASGENLEIRKTLIDFKTANLARVRTISTTLYSVIEDSTQSALIGVYIDDYLKQLAEKQEDFVFHYVASAPSAAFAKEASVPPSIIPTGEPAMQNLPAKDLDGRDVTASLGGDSFLAYLHMTEGSPMPREQLSGSAWAMVHVDKPIDTPIFVISRAKFLEPIILSRLAEVNKMSTWVPDVVDLESSPTSLTTTCKPTGHLGRTDATPKELALTPVDASAVGKDVLAKVRGPGAWYQYRYHRFVEDTETLTKVSQKATTQNWVFVPQGLNAESKATISIFGSTLVDFLTDLKVTSARGYVKSEWATTIVFDSSKPDQHIVCTTDVIVRPEITLEVTDKPVLSGDTMKEEILEPVRLELEKFSFSLQELAQGITDAFRIDWPFFMPTQSGNMFVYKAYFNGAADLVCQLHQ